MGRDCSTLFGVRFVGDSGSFGVGMVVKVWNLCDFIFISGSFIPKYKMNIKISYK